MKIRALTRILFFLTFAPCSSAQAEGFQGLPWGSSVSSIKIKFPEARQSPPSNDTHAICNNPDGTTYKCSVAQFLCAEHGTNCYPPLRVKNYLVGNHLFELVFGLSKTKTLSEVSLSFSGDLIGQTTQHAKAIYEGLLNSLESKYGKPSIEEHYTELANNVNGMHGAYAFFRWRIDGNRIALILSSRFDPNNRRLVDIGGAPSIKIIYSPLVDEAASRL